MKKIFRDLKVKLQPAEWNAIASALGAEQAKLFECEAEKAEAMTGYKKRLEAHGNKMAELGEKVRSREETRAVECFERQDEQRFVVELYRQDTGELVETRPMTSAERHDVLQSSLPGVSKEPPEPEHN
jgi:hypothetical protein